MTEFQDGNFIAMEVMGCQVHAIGKAIRPLFADPVTIIDSWVMSLHAGISEAINFYLLTLGGFNLVVIIVLNRELQYIVRMINFKLDYESKNKKQVNKETAKICETREVTYICRYASGHI